MEKGSDGLRERLLARLPQAENVAGYREETELLLARHRRALYWEKVTARTLMLIGVGLFMMANLTWGPKLDANGKIVFKDKA